MEIGLCHLEVELPSGFLLEREKLGLGCFVSKLIKFVFLDAVLGVPMSVGKTKLYYYTERE